MAIVGEGAKGRVYLNPTADHESITEIEPSWQPDTSLPEKALGFRVQAYGMVKHADLFTSRQLTALTTFSDLVQEARKKVLHDAVASGLADDGVPLDQGGSGATAYAEAIATYLALAIDKCADYWSSICSWHAGRDTIRNVFARHAIPTQLEIFQVR
jgi:putative DNA methylase